ncbi:MAG: alkaline phosphatase [Kiritimatiellaeota bacterium]|nr:alkaline phosphatase [Kiritimatiellota bacterium]
MKKLLVLCLLAPAVLLGNICPLPLGTAANTGFADETADDQKGGWIDLGGNDLRAMPPGELMAGGVPFTVADSQDASCIVLGGPTRAYLPKAAALDVPKDVAGKWLYLFHAAAFPPALNEVAGLLTVEYADAKTKPTEFRVRFGRDVADWHAPKSYPNAARAWTAYNGNTQVSLFASKFELATNTVKRVRFASKDATWMVVGVSLGDETPLRPLLPEFKVTKTFTPPPPLTAPLPCVTNDAAPRNVILIIGDGMGQGALKLTSLNQHRAEGRLIMQQLPFAGLCTTYPFGADVTDSAASGTAFACGHKTKNGMVGMLPNKKRVESVATEAKRAGRSVGIITSDAIYGATPAVFYAHSEKRGASQEIVDFLPGCGFDALIGDAGGRKIFLPKAQKGDRTDTRDVVAEMAAKGYAQAATIADFRAAPAGRPVLGFMDGKTALATETCLSELLETAVGRFEKNPKGFFIMLECSITDGGGHGNIPNTTVLGTTQVDWAVRTAVEYARARGDTLVIVTADHETGGLSANMSYATGDLTILYTTTSHTADPVAVYAFGPGAHRFSGRIDNTDIAKTIRALLE